MVVFIAHVKVQVYKKFFLRFLEKRKWKNAICRGILLSLFEIVSLTAMKIDAIERFSEKVLSLVLCAPNFFVCLSLSP